MSIKVRDAVQMAANQLADAGCGEPENDAELLYRYQFNLDKLGYFRAWSETLADELAEGYFDVVAKRAGRIPLQYITGEQDFMGHTFMVSPQVLIPRQDTEVLAETVLKDLGGESASVLDLCCGSGCIGISIALDNRSAKVSCSDISEDALALARKNAKALSASVHFAKGDLFEPFKKGLGKTRFDRIVCNPPYIPTGYIDSLEPEVKDYEPRIALDGGEDGMDFYRRVIAEAPYFLKDGGKLFLEIGWDQANDIRALVMKLFTEMHETENDRARKKLRAFGHVDIIRDLAGKDRVAVLTL